MAELNLARVQLDRKRNLEVEPAAAARCPAAQDNRWPNVSGPSKLRFLLEGF